MGFFGRLFKRKKGGTRVGNFIRQLAYDNTYTLLGENVANPEKASQINSNVIESASNGVPTRGNQMFWGD